MTKCDSNVIFLCCLNAASGIVMSGWRPLRKVIYAQDGGVLNRTRFEERSRLGFHTLINKETSRHAV